MMNRFLAGRVGYLLGFLASFGLVAFALYIQQKNGLEPCPLCISQRITYMALGVLFLVAGAHNPGQVGRRVYGVLQLAVAVTGIVIASRHIWIQANPDKVMAECGAGFDYLFQNFPAQRALQMIFKGTGECSTIDWTWLGMTIPQLSLAAFIGLGLFAVALVFVRKA